jgi:hypothetical protein
VKPQSLPPELTERTLDLAGRTPPAHGAFVLVWLRAALRSTENPAIDVGIAAAHRLGLPLFVYRGLSDRTPYANLRHHTFILEGQRDLEHGLARRGLGTAMHVEGPGRRPPALLQLGGRAALVVIDAFPLDPLRAWARRVADGVEAAVWEVDTARVVPRSRVNKAFDRAFAFRAAIEKELPERLRAGWADLPSPGRFVPSDLPFEPVDWATTSPADLAIGAQVDPTVGPGVLRGGERAAEQRWSTWVRSGGLKRYARQRNDPLLDGVSRMSPYLHYGMIAPTRLAREAYAHGGDGAEKFLDELIIWRELAWSFAERREVGDVGVLPAWARETLESHAGDPRPILPSEALERGRTGDAWWDVAQRGLVATGELHNNARMTWGKAVIGWTPDAARALATLEDLNHRYALDGRDPSSYGGILWCLGQFDRPFQPEVPVFGTVRPRDTATHAERLPPARWWAQVRPQRPSVLVIGAGLAGAMCARTLADHGVDVTVLDKGRGPGGRTSTRRLEGARVDHGAPCFPALPLALRRHQRAWEELGLWRRWEAGFMQRTSAGDARLDLGPRWVAAPGASAFVRHLLADLAPRWGAQVTKVTREGGRFVAWFGEERLAEADKVVVGAPTPQALNLLPTGAERARALVAPVRYNPVWVLMGHWHGGEPFSAGLMHLPHDPTLELVVREGSKPGRAGDPGVVAYASAAWSREHLEDPAEVAADHLRAALESAGLPVPDQAQAHRWRFARVAEPAGIPCFWDGDLGLCGDGLIGDGAHRAVMSGAALAGRILADEGVRTWGDGQMSFGQKSVEVTNA